MTGEMILHESLKVAIIVRRLTMGFAEEVAHGGLSDARQHAHNTL